MQVFRHVSSWKRPVAPREAGRYLVVREIMSFPVWLEDEGGFIGAATGNLISWSSFLSRSTVLSLALLSVPSAQGQVRRSVGEMKET